MPANVNPFATEEQWRAAGSPGGDYAAWLKTIGYGADGNRIGSQVSESLLYNADGSSKNGKVPAQQRNADGGVSSQTFASRLVAGEFAGNEAQATRREIEHRRRLIANNVSGSGGANGGFDVLPIDAADVALRDSVTGRVRRARGGSSRSAIMGSGFGGGQSSAFGGY